GALLLRLRAARRGEGRRRRLRRGHDRLGEEVREGPWRRERLRVPRRPLPRGRAGRAVRRLHGHGLLRLHRGPGRDRAGHAREDAPHDDHELPEGVRVARADPARALSAEPLPALPLHARPSGADPRGGRRDEVRPDRPRPRLADRRAPAGGMSDARPLRVLHVITRLIVGGAQENTLLTAEGLARMPEYDVTLASGVDRGPEG